MLAAISRQLTRLESMQNQMEGVKEENEWEKIDLVIVTGMSGAGKTVAIQSFEVIYIDSEAAHENGEDKKVSTLVTVWRIG